MGNLWRLLSSISLVAATLLLNAPPAMAHADHDIHRIAAGTTGMYMVNVWVEPAPSSTSRILLTISATHLGESGGADAVHVTSQLGDGTNEMVAAAPNALGYWQAEVSALPEGETALTVSVEGADGGELRFTYTPFGSSWLMTQLVVLAMAHGLVVSWWMWTRRKRAFRPVQPAVSMTAN